MISPHVIIVGAGFGGLKMARPLGNAPVQITLIDKQNYLVNVQKDYRRSSIPNKEMTIHPFFLVPSVRFELKVKGQKVPLS